MLTVQPGEIEVEERWYESNPTMRFKMAVPFNAETGNKDSAVGYFEVEAGKALPTHTDSAGEILLCLEGRVEVTLGNERSQISAGERWHSFLPWCHTLYATGAQRRSGSSVSS